MPTRRHFLSIAGALIAAPVVAPVLAREEGPTPLQLIRRVYSPRFDERELPMSRALRRGFEAARRRSDLDEAPAPGLDFAWAFGDADAADGWERTLQVRVVVQTIGSAVVEARFRNGGQRIVQYRLIREAGRWAIDDIDYGPARQRLSQLFERSVRRQG